MIAHYLIDPEQRHNLDRLAANLLNYSTIKIESLIGKKGVNQLNMKEVELDKIKDYGAEDADVTFQLYNILEKEIKNLIVYKKGLYNADDASESELLSMMGALINSESIWSSHALYLMAEFFYSKKELQKSKEFFKKIINLENSNEDIRIKAQKRLSRDLSD